MVKVKRLEESTLAEVGASVDTAAISLELVRERQRVAKAKRASPLTATALRREITLLHLLESKVRRAAETGEPFVGVGTLFP